MNFNGQLPPGSDDDQQSAAQKALLQAAMANTAASQPQAPAGMPPQAPQTAAMSPSAFPLMQAASQGDPSLPAPQAPTGPVNNPAITQAVLAKLLAQQPNRLAQAEGPTVIRPDSGYGRIIFKP